MCWVPLLVSYSLFVMWLFVCCSSLVCFLNSDLLYFSLCDVSCSFSLVANFLPVSLMYVMLHSSQLSLYTQLGLFFVHCFRFIVVYLG